MISYITGIPGSGKTALAVNHIIENKDSEKYTFIYCNINQFDFDKVPKSRPLDWDLLYVALIELHNLYKSKANDDVLIECASKHQLEKGLFVIDECHNYFDKKDPVLVWWLSYHRHLHQDIFLITQNLSLVESKYKAFAEIFYRASPSFLRFRHHVLKYTKFIGSRMTEKDKFGVDKLDTKKNRVFSYYKSGDNSKGGNIILKFMLIAGAFALLAFVLFQVFFGSKLPDKKEKSNANEVVLYAPTPKKALQVSNQAKDVAQVSSKERFKNYELISFKCINRICHFKNRSFAYDEIKRLIDITESEIIINSKSKYGYVTASFLASPLLKNILQGAPDEKNNNPANSMPNNIFTGR